VAAQGTFEYRRVPGQARQSFGLVYATRHTLWLGPDHLLAVTNQGYSESYKRFYFADVQALLLRRTPAYTVRNVVLGAFTGGGIGMALGGTMLRWHPAVSISFLVAGCLFGLGVLANLIRGPTCACHVRTAVQIEPLPSLNRVRRALRVIEALRQSVEAAQGRLTDAEAARHEQAAAALAAAADAAPAAPPSSARPRRTGAPVAVRPYRGHAHEALFAVLLADLCHTCVRFFTGGRAMLVLGAFLGLAIGVMAVVALVRQHGTDLPRGAKGAAWGTLGYLAFSHVYSMAYSVLLTLSHPQSAGNSWEQAGLAASVSPFESAGMMIFLVLSAVSAALLGFGGLLSLRRRAPAVAPGK
jgi:hypothetical protein